MWHSTRGCCTSRLSGSITFVDASAIVSLIRPITHSDCLGVPLPGVELALVPSDAKLEPRVRGTNLTPGHHQRSDLSSAAFDEHGYLHTGTR